jgi:hypothetical protein
VSAVDDPVAVTVALCQSTAYCTSHGHSCSDAPASDLMTAADSEIIPMTRSAIGLRSWS